MITRSGRFLQSPVKRIAGRAEKLPRLLEFRGSGGTGWEALEYRKLNSYLHYSSVFITGMNLQENGDRENWM